MLRGVVFLPVASKAVLLGNLIS
uniref:Uncharacterized protein n=1 Tax=Arundo donax TaxID=35708 RepID=A0A0A9FY46_ARUDO